MRFVYVDNSNLWLAGQQVAQRHGCARQGRWSPDYEALAELLGGDRCVLFGSGACHPVWTAAKAAGFEVVTTSRRGREKRVDVSLVTRCMADSFRQMDPVRGDEVVLVTGDADFEPLVADLAERGLPTTVVAWSHSLSGRLGRLAQSVQLLDEHIGRLTHDRSGHGLRTVA